MSRVPPAMSTRLGTTTRTRGVPSGGFRFPIPPLLLRCDALIFCNTGRGEERPIRTLSDRRFPMPPVKIRWFGHSGFSLQDPSGKTVLIDPWFQGNPTAPSGPEEVKKAEFLLLTHDHFDHAADAAALARPTRALGVGGFAPV